jgi:O-antigen/teichoic acid export membrane protein
MNDVETRLSAALSAEEPPARDAVFRVEVLLRLEQARFRRQVQRTVVIAILAAGLAVASAPGITAWIAADDQRLWLVALGTAVALCVLSLVLIAPRFRRMASHVSRLLYP